MTIYGQNSKKVFMLGEKLNSKMFIMFLALPLAYALCVCTFKQNLQQLHKLSNLVLLFIYHLILIIILLFTVLLFIIMYLLK